MELPQYPSITGGLQNAAKEINQAIPRRNPLPKQPQVTPQQPIQKAFKQPIVQPKMGYPEDPLVAKIRKWVLIGLSALVAGSAIILIIVSVIRKIF